MIPLYSYFQGKFLYYQKGYGVIIESRGVCSDNYGVVGRLEGAGFSVLENRGQV